MMEFGKEHDDERKQCKKLKENESKYKQIHREKKKKMKKGCLHMNSSIIPSHSRMTCAILSFQ